MKRLEEFVNEQEIDEGKLSDWFKNIFSGVSDKIKTEFKEISKEYNAQQKAAALEIAKDESDEARKTLENMKKAKDDKKKQLEILMKDVKEYSEDEDTKNTKAFAKLICYANTLATDLKNTDAQKTLQEYAKSTDNETQKFLKDVLKDIEKVANKIEGEQKTEEIKPEDVKTPQGTPGDKTDMITGLIMGMLGNKSVSESYINESNQIIKQIKNEINSGTGFSKSKTFQALVNAISGVVSIAGILNIKIDQVASSLQHMLADKDIIKTTQEYLDKKKGND